MPWTEWSQFTNDELLRIVAQKSKLTSLEAELATRLADLENHVTELAGDQMELPLQ